MKCKLFFILLFLISLPTQAQEFGIQTGYTNSGRSYGYLGIDARLTQKSCLNIGVGSFVGIKNDKGYLLPEIHINMLPLEKHNNAIFNHVFMVEVAATNKNLNPSTGINILNFLKIKTGYSYPYNAKEDFEGVTFGITFSIGSKDYTDRIKMF